MPSKLLTERETSDYLGVASATLRRWRVEGNGPAFVKIGRAVRYQAEVLAAYVDSRSANSTSAKLEG